MKNLIIFALISLFITNTGYSITRAQEHFYKGVNLELTGKDLLAISEYNRTISLNKKYLKAYLNLSVIYIKQKMFSNAQILLDNALNIFPANAELLSNYGIYKLIVGDTKGAIAAYEQALKQSPYNAKIYYNYALIFEKIGNLKKAVDKYEMAIKLNDKYADAFNNLSNIYVKIGKYKKALSILKKCKAPSSTTYFNMGLLYEKLGRLTNAEAAYNQVLNISKGNSSALYRLGTVYIKRQFYIKAKPIFEKLVKADETNIDYLTELAEVYSNLGLKNKAYTYYRKALNLYHKQILRKSSTGK